jgi:hypothetical protein
MEKFLILAYVFRSFIQWSVSPIISAHYGAEHHGGSMCSSNLAQLMAHRRQRVRKGQRTGYMFLRYAPSDYFIQPSPTS